MLKMHLYNQINQGVIGEGCMLYDHHKVEEIL